MKTLVMILGLCLSMPVCAHDEGHGPKLTDTPKQGGLLASVVDAKEIKLGPKAAGLYKAELVRMEDSAVWVFLYDNDMEPLSLEGVSKKAKAVVIAFKKGKEIKKGFTLTLDKEEEAFIGTAPKVKRKPYNIDVTFKIGKKKLFAAFDNLD